MSIRIKKVESVEALIKEQDSALNRVRNIQTELYERGAVEHEFHSPVHHTAYSEITPALASKMLKRFNGGKGVEATNRNMNRKAVEKISKDMKDKDFHGSVSHIVFDDDGILMDGQTRLQAVLNSKVTCNMNVTMGAPRKGMIKIDIGRKRNSADRFRLAGKFGECTNTQARWYERLARFSLFSSPGTNRIPYSYPQHNSITDVQIEEEMDRLSEPIKYITENLSPKKELQKLPMLVAVAQWWVEHDSAGALQGQEAKQFYDDLVRGNRLNIGDPLFTLREKMLEIDWGRLAQSQREGYAMCYGWTIHAINKHVNCETLNRLTKRTVSFKLDLP